MHEPLQGSFIRYVEFYKGRAKSPVHRVSLVWWDLQFLWNKFPFQKATGKSWRNYELDTDTAAIQQLMQYFLAESRRPESPFCNPQMQQMIADDLQDLEEGFRIQNPRRIVIALREWDAG
ncbi:MAG: hypothetical protein JNL57_04400 [Bacteroidetes bacterium]|nr:hypothetical protein [Bacteroidota bacterium]